MNSNGNERSNPYDVDTSPMHRLTLLRKFLKKYRKNKMLLFTQMSSSVDSFLALVYERMNESTGEPIFIGVYSPLLRRWLSIHRREYGIFNTIFQRVHKFCVLRCSPTKSCRRHYYSGMFMDQRYSPFHRLLLPS